MWQDDNGAKKSIGTAPQSVKITNIADNKFSVSWTTQEPTIGKIEYGETGEKLDKQKGDDRGEKFVGKTHHITITDLQPATNYAFRILSGDGLQRFDNNGSVYTTATGTTIASVPAARSLYGDVTNASEDTIVYVTMPDAQPASVTLNSKGSYSIPLSTIRSADLKNFVSYDPAATVVSLLLDNGLAKSIVTVSTTNIAPVPTIAMGENADFRSLPGQEKPVTTQIAQVEPQSSEMPLASNEPRQTQPLEIFNVEPLAEPEINAVTDGAYSLTNPAVEGEVLSTTKPEFRGTGAANATMTISITGQKTVTDTVRISADGSWSWSPAIALSLGKQKITITYKDKDGKTQTIVRNFSVSAASATSQPAFVSTPSASTTTKVATASPRTSIPATDSGVPVTGVITPLLLTSALGFAIMVLGAFLLAL
ncbi:MAG: hypothetical protein Fur0011_1070 [Candidatus Microgenomates bacterium]